MGCCTDRRASKPYTRLRVDDLAEGVKLLANSSQFTPAAHEATGTDGAPVSELHSGTRSGSQQNRQQSMHATLPHPT
jgi:hypothetical protein